MTKKKKVFRGSVVCLSCKRSLDLLKDKRCGVCDCLFCRRCFPPRSFCGKAERMGLCFFCQFNSLTCRACQQLLSNDHYDEGSYLIGPACQGNHCYSCLREEKIAVDKVCEYCFQNIQAILLDCIPLPTDVVHRILILYVDVQAAVTNKRKFVTWQLGPKPIHSETYYDSSADSGGKGRNDHYKHHNSPLQPNRGSFPWMLTGLFLFFVCCYLWPY